MVGGEGRGSGYRDAKPSRLRGNCGNAAARGCTLGWYAFAPSERGNDRKGQCGHSWPGVADEMVCVRSFGAGKCSEGAIWTLIDRGCRWDGMSPTLGRGECMRGNVWVGECPEGAMHTSPEQRSGEKLPTHCGVLKGRCIMPYCHPAAGLCGVPSERNS